MRVSCVPRVIKPEEGKKLADSWGAAFMESSAKENQVNTGGHLPKTTLLKKITLLPPYRYFLKQYNFVMIVGC